MASRFHNPDRAIRNLVRKTDHDQIGALRSDQLAAATLFLAPLRGSG